MITKSRALLAISIACTLYTLVVAITLIPALIAALNGAS